MQLRYLTVLCAVAHMKSHGERFSTTELELSEDTERLCDDLVTDEFLVCRTVGLEITVNHRRSPLGSGTSRHIKQYMLTEKAEVFLEALEDMEHPEKVTSWEMPE